jgi:hypothetical protein
MPKNIIPKDNIPKIEEIREVDNKIPTYEEFVKNYQVDQTVSDSYESEIANYINIGTSKVSGPCYYSNPDCPCYVSQGFIQMYMSCSATGCANRNINN